MDVQVVAEGPDGATRSNQGNFCGVLRHYTRLKHFLSGSVVHGDECGVSVELPMEKIAAVPFGHDAVRTDYFWIECCAHWLGQRNGSLWRNWLLRVCDSC